jgi:hypothetical protein
MVFGVFLSIPDFLCLTTVSPLELTWKVTPTTHIVLLPLSTLSCALYSPCRVEGTLKKD